MKRVAITGHTCGIGAAVFVLMSTDYEVLGFSRSNGYDISADLSNLVADAHHCEILVNNAYHDTAQIEVFNHFYRHWKDDPTKTIVNINSRAKYDNNIGRPYSDNKRGLSKVADPANTYDRKCRIINIYPGWVITERVKPYIGDDPAMTADQCAEYILWAIEQPVEIGELALWKI